MPHTEQLQSKRCSPSTEFDGTKKDWKKNSAGALLVENTVTTLTALNDIPRLQSVLHSTISTDVAHRLWSRIHL
uniref:Uncharacterized protein n=1 Tax=Rhizophora mucronata TaxID=61149 RepID=A0A2P2K5A1_RHIMU